MKTLNALQRRFFLFKLSLFVIAALVANPVCAGYYFVSKDPIIMCSHCHKHRYHSVDTCEDYSNRSGELRVYAGQQGKNSYSISVYSPAPIYELNQQNMWCEECTVISNPEHYEVYQADPDNAFASGETYDNPNKDPNIIVGTAED